MSASTTGPPAGSPAICSAASSGTERPGKVALFAGSLSYRGHEEREMGFRHILAEELPNLTIVELREMLDDREKAYAEAAALLDRHPDLAGIYNIGAGNTGIARALKERGREQQVVFIGHEVTEGTKALLLDGTLDAVIDQNPRVEAREALNLLGRAVRGLPYRDPPAAAAGDLQGEHSGDLSAALADRAGAKPGPIARPAAMA